MVWLEGRISPDMAKNLMGSFGQVAHGFARLFNHTTVGGARKQNEPMAGVDSGGNPSNHNIEESIKDNRIQSEHSLPLAFQADVANFLFLSGLIVFVIYRIARHRQARQLHVQR